MSKESGVTAPSIAITPRVNWLQTETKKYNNEEFFGD